MTDKRSRLLWEAGICLNEAWLHFAIPTERDRHQSLPTELETLEAEARSADNPGGWSGVGLAFSNMIAAKQKKSHSELNLKSNLLDQIFNGDLELLGFRMEPTKSRAPVIVAASELETYEPNWGAETIQIRDELYVDLRVSPANHRPTGRKRGRPGSTDLIRREIAELIADPSNCFCDLPRKAAIEMVIRSLSAKGHDTGKAGMGLSNQNVAKLIVEQCPKRKLK